MYFQLIFNKTPSLTWDQSQIKTMIDSLTDRVNKTVERVIQDEIDRYIKELMEINRISEQGSVSANIDNAIREKLGLDIDQIHA